MKEEKWWKERDILLCKEILYCYNFECCHVPKRRLDRVRLSWLASVEGNVLLSWERKRNDEWEKGRAVIVWYEKSENALKGKERERTAKIDFKLLAS